jgi:uncharacterized protein
VAVNGNRIQSDLTSGKFLAVQRTWKDGDRIEMEMEMPITLEPVDSKNPNTVALLRGPIALFGVGNMPERITRQQMLAATAFAQSSEDWIVKTDTSSLTLRPFATIMNEDYRLYHLIEG